MSQSGTVGFSGGGSAPVTATGSWSVDSHNVFGIKMTSPGASYTSAPTITIPVAGCAGGSPSFTAHLTTSVIIIGDTNTSAGNASGPNAGSSFGARLMNLTVDCNSVPNCTGIELQNAQEQSGPMFVNVVNYSGRCLWVHGQSTAIGTDNSFAFQIECNGYYSPGANGTAGATMTFATVPVEFDNTKSRGIVGATVNPVSASTALALTGISSCTASGGTFTATGTPSSNLPSNWNTTPPYGLSAYTTLSGYTLTNAGWNNTYPITVNYPTSFTINGVGPCPTSSASGGSATLEPSADVIVCSGTACAGGIDQGQNNPTQVSLTQVHTEHAGTGYFITGTNTSAEILAPTTTVGGGSMFAGVTIDSANKPASVNVTSLLANSGIQLMVVDGINGASVPAPSGNGSVLAHYVSGTTYFPQSLLGPTGLQPIVAEKTGNYTVSPNDNFTTFDNYNATTAITYTLPTPVAGMTYTFLESASTAQNVFITTASGISILANQFTNCANTSIGHLNLKAAASASITIQAINSTIWRATSCGGTWTAP
jgi:hypothetical protein